MGMLRQEWPECTPEEVEAAWKADREADTGRLDIVFKHGYREDVYFSLECKRLNVQFPSGFQSLASDYVDDGLQRYIKEKYAKGLDNGTTFSP